MPPPPPSLFQTTLWTEVVGASAGPAATQRALDELCRRYWQPLYVYTLGRGYAHADAEDATQAFFAKLLENRALLGRADRALGRFRSYLLTAFKNFLADQYAKERTQRRGGGMVHVPLDDVSGAAPQGSGETPDEAYDRQWALVLVERAREATRNEYVAAGKEAWFDRLGGSLSSDSSYADLASELHSTIDAIKGFVQRMKRRFRLALEREVAATVADSGELEGEMAYLASLLRQP
jgi:DNA-directed RNA polymerase specialized sigma24 family protein